MNCRSKIFLSSLLLLALCSFLSVGALGAGTQYVISWISTSQFSVPYVSGATWYEVYTNATGTWTVMNEFEMDSSSVPRVITVYSWDSSYYVLAFDNMGGDLQYTSNTLNFHLASFRAEYFDIGNLTYVLDWDTVDNAYSYQVQYSLNNGSTWSVAPSGALDRFHNTYFLNNDVYLDGIMRVVAKDQSGKIIAVSVYVPIKDITFIEDYDITMPPFDRPAITLPDDPPLTDAPPTYYEKEKVVNTYNLMFSFLRYSDFGSLCILAMTILASFAVLSYIVFKMH